MNTNCVSFSLRSIIRKRKTKKKYFLFENEEVKILERKKDRIPILFTRESTSRINTDTIFKHKLSASPYKSNKHACNVRNFKEVVCHRIPRTTMVSSYSGHVTLFLISSWPLGRNLFEYRRARFRATRR